MLRILLVDDHDLTRAGLCYLLEKQKDWNVCGEASNGRTAVQLTIECAPDLVILDMSIPELNGIEATRQILKNAPRTKILIYTMHETERIIVDALNAGVSGIVLKSDAGENMVHAVEQVAKGRRFFTSHVAETVVNACMSKMSGTVDETSPQVMLTSREQEIVQLLAHGKSNKEIADCLCISTRTVEGHRAEIMKRLRIGSLAELILYAVRNDMVLP
jgi:DNA-binding NarL/FixJ family response regulator